MRGAGIYLFFQVQDVLLHIRAFRMNFRIARCGNVKLSMVVQFLNQVTSIAVICLWRNIRIAVSAQCQNVFNLICPQLIQHLSDMFLSGI